MPAETTEQRQVRTEVRGSCLTNNCVKISTQADYYYYYYYYYY